MSTSNKPMTLPVVEIFDSIQGEGSHLGRLVTFVRLAGCNLRCPWCDTKESWAVDTDQFLLIEDIVKECTQQMIVITGGEPLMHNNVFELIKQLHGVGKYVAIETNGTLPSEGWVDGGELVLPDWVTASPKPPFYKMNVGCYANEYKFVMDNTLDWDKHVYPILLENNDPRVPVWFQPNGENIPETAAQAYEMVERHSQGMNGYAQLRVGIQMHKLLNFK